MPYISSLRNVTVTCVSVGYLVSYGVRGITGTPQYNFLAAERVVEESNLDCDNTRLLGLEATKPGEKLSRPSPGPPLQCPECSGIRDRAAYTDTRSACTSYLHGRGAPVAYHPRMLERHPDNPGYSGGPGLGRDRSQGLLFWGAGWASCRFLKGIDTNIYDVVCVSPRNHMVFTPLLTSTCVGTLEFRSVAEPVSRIQPALVTAPNSYFYLAYCKGVDLDKHEVSNLSYVLSFFVLIHTMLLSHKYAIRHIYCEIVSNSGLPQEPYRFKVAYDKLVIAAGADDI
ncbi:hypothetical protein GIB67_010658 [Kingdonia uniflora]|uniref:Uncharacterized protein n=1 Tax=Kingdonia uniflora TaxID=39325 RepID=A0A7J7MN09_9MAGN|nr:hypothetical protein GIB67_010658 [Kingdonia uniflora]